jgi:hypothetical protein
LAVYLTRPTLVVSRRFAASPEGLFDAWFDPKAVGTWLFATPGGVSKHVEIDARLGGGFVEWQSNFTRRRNRHGDQLAQILSGFVGYRFPGYAARLGGKSSRCAQADEAGAVCGESSQHAARPRDGANTRNDGILDLLWNAILQDRLLAADLLQRQLAYAWHDLLLALAQQAEAGRVDLPAMENALSRVKSTGAGLPGLGTGKLAKLERIVARWRGAGVPSS